jgi:hypothetical protein
MRNPCRLPQCRPPEIYYWPWRSAPKCVAPWCSTPRRSYLGSASSGLPISAEHGRVTVAGVCAGSGVVFLNNGPTGNKRGMLEQRGDLEATADVLLRQRFSEWGSEGCWSRTVSDEPSYWLWRFLAVFKHKWVQGQHLSTPCNAISYFKHA